MTIENIYHILWTFDGQYDIINDEEKRNLIKEEELLQKAYRTKSNLKYRMETMKGIITDNNL